jgi:hypothetical protein
MQSENVIQANQSSETIGEIKPAKRIYERFGVSPCHLGPDGKRVGSDIVINMRVKTNESKEMLLSYVDTLKNLIVESIEENYEAFVADTDVSELCLAGAYTWDPEHKTAQ